MLHWIVFIIIIIIINETLMLNSGDAGVSCTARYTPQTNRRSEGEVQAT